MTSIILHGILASEFGKEMALSINRPKEIIEAIDANNPNFKKRISELAQKGIHYSLILDGKSVKKLEEFHIKKSPVIVDIVPLICGQGAVAAGVVAVGAFAASAAAASGVAVGLTAATWASIGVMALGMAVQMALAPKPEAMDRTESTISGAKQSFLMNSKGNIAEQGNPVPVGYGRLRVGSRIIQTTIKSYPQKHSVENALIGDHISNDADASLKEIK